jgi:hypothetical protein
VTDLPEKRTEFNPASLIVRLSPLPAAFSVDTELQWDVTKEAAFSFALRVEVDDEIRVPDEARARGADLIRKLADDDIAVRDAAMLELVKLGPAAVTQLGEASVSEEAEVRVRARRVIELIHKESPPQMIRAGFTNRDETGTHLTQTFMLGRSRGELWKHLKVTDSASISIHRTASAYTQIEWDQVHWPKGEKVPGRIGRLRFDFWGDQGGKIGSVCVRRVVVRRYVELRPEMRLSAEEAIR